MSDVAAIRAEEAAVLARIGAGSAAQSRTENFPVALKILPNGPRTHLLRVYGFARFVDDVGDSAPGDRLRLLDVIDNDVRDLSSGGATLAPVAALRPTIAGCELPLQPFLDLIEANRLDQCVTRYASFDDLIGYCGLSAAPVGRIVLGIAGRSTLHNVVDSDAVCNALQILEHCQDVGEDARAGRIYLPTDDLWAVGVREDELLGSVTGASLREVVAMQVDRASEMLQAGNGLVRRLSGWARLAVSGFVAGGLATADALRRADYDVLATAVRPLSGADSRAGDRSGGPVVSRTDPRTDAAYAECQRITREQARNFSWGIRLLPETKRKALAAVYALARRIDDIGDGDLPAEQKLTLLAEARQGAISPAAHRDDLVLRALADAADRLPIPLDAFTDLIDGCEMDVMGTSYDTQDDLVRYCRYVAGSIGRLSLGVFDPELSAAELARAFDLADSLGVALQLTNVLRDIREDLSLGRVYLAKQDLALFGCEIGTLPDGTLDPQDGTLAELIRFEAARAWGWYDEGFKLLPLLDRRSAACCEAMAGIYSELLSRIAHDPSQVMKGRMSLPASEKLRLAGRSILRAGVRGG